MTTYNILLIEDDIEISEMLKNYLATEHYEITCAFDGRNACRILTPPASTLSCWI